MQKNLSETGIVALTIKVKLENNSDRPVDVTKLGMILKANDNQMSYLSQSTLEPTQQREDMEAGNSEEILRVFLIDKDRFSIIQKLKLEVGPFRDSDGKELFNGKKAEFDIPFPSN